VRDEVTVIALPMVESDWDDYVSTKGRDLGGAACAHTESPIVFYNGANFIGGAEGFVQWVADQYEYEDKTPASVYQDIASAEYDAHLRSLGHQFVYMDVTVGEGDAERVVFELFSDVCPKTCENFRALCTGERGTAALPDEGKVDLTYERCMFHRVVKGGWVQGGDIVSGAGDGGFSIYGEDFPDESFAVAHGGPGVLAMANCGPHTNASQFFVSLRALDFMNKNAVAFGRVVSGMGAIRRLAAVETENERPTVPCRVAACGQLALASEEQKE